MIVEIKVFKPTGKFYASEIVKSDKELKLFQDEFRQFVCDNLPALYSGGYVVVSNADSESNEFYEALYKTDELISQSEGD